MQGRYYDKFEEILIGLLGRCELVLFLVGNEVVDSG